jgi:hypothetical protein
MARWWLQFRDIVSLYRHEQLVNSQGVGRIMNGRSILGLFKNTLSTIKVI